MSKSTGSGPDSARSWAVAFAAFVLNILLSGISRTTGLFYVALINTYGVTRMEANMPFTIRNIVRNLLGPLVGVIGHHYGASGATMAGGLFAAAGVALCAFAPNLMWISILWGGVHGIGVALGNTLFRVTIFQYFEKYRATASGFAFSGGCVGTLVFPAILEYLLTHFGLPETFLITGALMLHVIPAGILLKEPPWIKKESKKCSSQTIVNPDVPDAIKKSPKQENIKKLGAQENKGNTADIFFITLKEKSLINDVHSKADLSLIAKDEDNTKKGIDNPAFEEEDMKESVQKIRTADDSHQSPLPQKSSSTYQDAILMVCDPMFHMISISYAFFIILFDISLTVVVDYLKDKGFHEKDGKYFICLIAVGDLVGRLGFGWVTDRKYLSPATFTMVLQILQGITFGMMTLFNSFAPLMILVVFCGAASGACLVMYPVLVAKYLPNLQSLTAGCMCLAGGISSFGVPPMIGYFRDTFGSYDGLYLIIGSLSAMSGFLWLTEPLVLKLRRRTETGHGSTAKKFKLEQKTSNILP